jgi:anti-sigma regulatory factor (Ser/Thr protein kinase)
MSAQTLSVPWAMSSAVQVRRTVVSELRALEVGVTVVDEAEIVVSELFANAVRHAQALPDGTIRVSWSVSAGAVEVAVTDGGGPTTPRPAPPSMWSANGRGLSIVRSLAHDWGVEENGGGRTVWVSLGGPSDRRQ